MANQSPMHDTGSDGLTAFTADRQRMWQGFSNATAGVVVFVVILLVGMAVFLL